MPYTILIFLVFRVYLDYHIYFVFYRVIESEVHKKSDLPCAKVEVRNFESQPFVVVAPACNYACRSLPCQER